MSIDDCFLDMGDLNQGELQPFIENVSLEINSQSGSQSADSTLAADLSLHLEEPAGAVNKVVTPSASLSDFKVEEQFLSVANDSSFSLSIFSDIFSFDLGEQDILRRVADCEENLTPASDTLTEPVQPSPANVNEADIPLDIQPVLNNMDNEAPSPNTPSGDNVTKKKRGRKPNLDKPEKQKKPKLWEREDADDPLVARAKAQRDKREKHKAEFAALRQERDDLKKENTQLKEMVMEFQAKIGELEKKIDVMTQHAQSIMEIKNKDS